MLFEPAKNFWFTLDEPRAITVVTDAIAVECAITFVTDAVAAVVVSRKGNQRGTPGSMNG